MIRMQNKNTSAQVNNLMQNMSVDMPGEITATMDGRVNDESNKQIRAINTGTTNTEKSCGFQMEKPKLPKFSGDVREYVIFWADFKHAIESRYSKCNAITL